MSKSNLGKAQKRRLRNVQKEQRKNKVANDLEFLANFKKGQASVNPLKRLHGGKPA